MSDNSLGPYLRASSQRDSDTALDQLFSCTLQPVIERTLRSKLHTSLQINDLTKANQDALELVSECRVLLMTGLRKLKSDHDSVPIRDVRSYAASVATNAFRHFLRKKYPLRQQLRSKLRYLLTHHPKFDLWDGPSVGWLCGFRNAGRRPGIDPQDTSAIVERIFKTEDPDLMRESTGTLKLVTAIFENTGGPIRFDDLLIVVSEIQSVMDEPGSFSIDDENGRVPEPIDLGQRVDLKNEAKQYLENVWSEIAGLPERHRLALVLNLCDRQGDCVVSLLPLLRIASITQISEALGFKPEEFALIWPHLPWDDNAIAAHMGITRQQVINLRQTARASLNRKLGRKLES